MIGSGHTHIVVNQKRNETKGNDGFALPKEGALTTVRYHIIYSLLKYLYICIYSPQTTSKASAFGEAPL